MAEWTCWRVIHVRGYASGLWTVPRRYYYSFDLPLFFQHPPPWDPKQLWAQDKHASHELCPPDQGTTIAATPLDSEVNTDCHSLRRSPAPFCRCSSPCLDGIWAQVMVFQSVLCSERKFAPAHLCDR